MIFSIMVLGSPASHEAAGSALRFTRAVIESGHKLHRVFFYHDGVSGASKLQLTPQGELPVAQQWQQLASEHDIDLIVCIASALKRGIVDADEAERHELDSANLLEGFAISGLGQLIDASIESDRMVTFGP